MTDEEKAEKWTLENRCAKCNLEGCSKTMNSSCFRLHVADYLAGLKAGREEAKKQWHDCFLSCSSPYCAGHFPAVKMEGELGNMSKRE